MRVQTLKILNNIKNENLNEIINTILELYRANCILIPEEIAIMIPIYYSNKDDVQDTFLSYVSAFMMGLYNGNSKK